MSMNAIFVLEYPMVKVCFTKVRCKGTQVFLWECETGARWSGVLGNQMWIKRLRDQNNEVSIVKLKSKFGYPCVLST